jgi:L,D-peptidoglycan transpeptidase YkuD (ErfK/YbiS/YcfS/YnhG family)
MLVLPGSAAADGDLPAHHPSLLTGLSSSAQVVVVTSARWSTSRARLRAYERLEDGSWALVAGPIAARIGRAGWVPAKTRRQGTGTTPAGTFRLPSAFGTEPDPGTGLPYRHVDGNDWWPYDPRDAATYNVLQSRRSPASEWRRSWAENLSEFGRQYRHAAVVDFNLPGGVHRSRGERIASRPADVRRGGGIFLHVLKAPRFDQATTGCVAIPQRHLVELLRWLEPTADPRIVMGPRSALR